VVSLGALDVAVAVLQLTDDGSAAITPFVSAAAPSSGLVPGAEVVVHGAPFGLQMLSGAVLRGTVAAVDGDGNRGLFLADVRAPPGLEGAPVFLSGQC
jgi:S1-C subfamily serine protease